MRSRLGFCLLFVLALHVAVTVAEFETLTRVVFAAIQAGGAVTVALQARRRERGRSAWAFAAGGLGLWAACSVATVLDAEVLSAVLSAGMFVCVCGSIIALLRLSVRPVASWLVIDGVLIGLTLTAVAVLRYGPLATDIDLAGRLTLASDIVVLVLVLVGFSAAAWRPSRVWWLAGPGFIAATAADALVIVRGVEITHVLPLWSITVMGIVLASSEPTPSAQRARAGLSISLLPVSGCVISIAIVLYGGLTGAAPAASALAAAALLAGVARAVLMAYHNVLLLQKARHEALTDKLTDLPNRRALLRDLQQACDSGDPHTLLFFDLDGFKDYNDAYGHQAGDDLLRELAGRLATVGGRAYRLGGDEFCLLGSELSEDTPARAVAALTHGAVSASHGGVTLPAEARTAESALHTADERMYADKRHRKAWRGAPTETQEIPPPAQLLQPR